MTQYKVTFAYAYPEWGDIELEAESKEEAEKLALSEIEISYPEAVDIEIEDVFEVTKNG